MPSPVSQFARGVMPVQPTEVVALGITSELIQKIAELQAAANAAQNRLPLPPVRGGAR